MLTTLLALAFCGTQPVRQCVTAPVYQLQHQQYVTGYNYAQPTRYVDAVSYIAYDNYYSKLVGSQARQQAANQAEVDLTRQIGLLTTELGQLRQVLAQTSPATPTPPIVPPAPPIVPPAPPIVPPPVLPLSDLAKSATTILQSKCSACHTGAAKAGSGLQLLQSAGVLATIAPITKLQIDQQVYSGAMPPDPKQALTAEEYSTLRAWINEDKDNITQILDNYKEPTK